MKRKQNRIQAIFTAMIFLCLAAACSPNIEQNTGDEIVPPQPATARATATATPTPNPIILLQPTASQSRCAGLSGAIEVQVLVGPAEAVGLEPTAAGSVPFSTSGTAPPYTITGGGPISYSDQLVKEWGTYTVTMDLNFILDGTCTGEDGSETLQIKMDMTGSQLVNVEAEGFQGEYPWEGEKSFDLAFPFEEGATIEGEGYALVLHLNNP